MKMKATILSRHNDHQVTVSTNNDVKAVTISPKSSGYGSSINGGELLLLSLATCYCNDIYREAAKRNITVTEVHVEFTGEFGAEGEPGTNFQYKPVIKSDASPEQLQELIDHTDSIAEIHKTPRQGLNITIFK
jgi:uncharacterized OsmC-like protein